MPDWTTPKTWVSGEAVTAAELNAQVRDNLGHLRAARHAILGMLSSPSVSASSWYTIAWEFAAVETIEVWAASPYPDRIAPSVAGYYLVQTRVTWPASTDGNRACRLLLNGTTTVAQDTRAAISNTHNTSTQHVVYCNGAGDYLAVQAWHNAATAQTLANAAAPVTNCSVIWLGA